MGGVRPKASVEDPSKLWLAKFPEKTDKHSKSGDLALTVGAHGRVASQYKLLSRCDAFGLSRAEATAIMDAMRKGGLRLTRMLRQTGSRKPQHRTQSVQTP